MNLLLIDRLNTLLQRLEEGLNDEDTEAVPTPVIDQGLVSKSLSGQAVEDDDDDAGKAEETAELENIQASTPIPNTPDEQRAVMKGALLKLVTEIEKYEKEGKPPRSNVHVAYTISMHLLEPLIIG